jgi:hypothetical protein
LYSAASPASSQQNIFRWHASQNIKQPTKEFCLFLEAYSHLKQIFKMRCCIGLIPDEVLHQRYAVSTTLIASAPHYNRLLRLRERPRELSRAKLEQNGINQRRENFVDSWMLAHS